MYPYTIQIAGFREPIDAVKVAYGHSNETGKVFVYILTPDNRIVSFDNENPSHILWENIPSQEGIDFVNRLFDEMVVKQNEERPKISPGVECQ
jgi:hypothetical protein